VTDKVASILLQEKQILEEIEQQAKSYHPTNAAVRPASLPEKKSVNPKRKITKILILCGFSVWVYVRCVRQKSSGLWQKFFQIAVKNKIDF
jgi:hypothetical protein